MEEMNNCEKNGIVEYCKKHKNGIKTIATIFFNLLTLVLAVLGLLSFKNDVLFFILYFIPYVSSLILLLYSYTIHKKYDTIKKEHLNNTNFLFTKNIKGVIAKLKDCENNLWNSYTEFAENIQNSSTKDEEGNIIIDSNEMQVFYKDIKKTSNELFKSVVEFLKSVIDNHFGFSENTESVSVCIKQLDRCYNRKSNSIPDDLHAFAIYRDNKSYNDDREIGKPYTVNKNTPFFSCLTSQASREAYYIENDIKKALAGHSYVCENQDEIIAKGTYNATMVVPICQNILTEKIYYGFLCIDAKASEKEIFNPNELLSILQSYSDILATYYHNVSMYFPIIFDYFYHQYKTNGNEADN